MSHTMIAPERERPQATRYAAPAMRGEPSRRALAIHGFLRHQSKEAALVQPNQERRQHD